jgi:serine/threonine-protein kinase RsbW
MCRRVFHGSRDRCGEAAASPSRLDSDVTVALEDSGPEFDPRNRPMPTEEDLALPLERRDIRGPGIFLALKSVDEFRYERRGDRNLNVFTIRRAARG